MVCCDLPAVSWFCALHLYLFLNNYDVRGDLKRHKGLLDIIFGAFYAIVLYNYTKELKESRCKCSETWSRDFMYNYSLLILGLYIIIYFASITALIQTRVFMTLITTLFNSKKAGLFKYISKFKITSNYLK